MTDKVVPLVAWLDGKKVHLGRAEVRETVHGLEISATMTTPEGQSFGLQAIPSDVRFSLDPAIEEITLVPPQKEIPRQITSGMKFVGLAPSNLSAQEDEFLTEWVKRYNEERD